MKYAKFNPPIIIMRKVLIVLSLSITAITCKAQDFIHYQTTADASWQKRQVVSATYKRERAGSRFPQ